MFSISFLFTALKIVPEPIESVCSGQSRSIDTLSFNIISILRATLIRLSLGLDCAGKSHALRAGAGGLEF